MPEIANTPIFSSFSSSVSRITASASTTRANSTPSAAGSASSAAPGVAGAGNTNVVSSPSGDSGPPAGKEADSFSGILKHQLDQAATPTAPQPATLADIAATAAAQNPGQSLNAVQILNLSDRLPSSRLLGGGLSELANSATDGASTTADSSTMSAQDLASIVLLMTPGQNAGATNNAAAIPAPEAAVLQLAQLDAAQLAKLLLSGRTGAEPLAKDSSKGESLTASSSNALSDGSTDPGTPDNTSLAALLAFFPPLTANGATNPTAGLPASSSEGMGTRLRSQEGSEHANLTQASGPDVASLLAMTTLQTQSGQNKGGTDGELPLSDLAEKSQLAASKTADFAAAMAASAETASLQARNSEATSAGNAEAGFGNMLAAAQLASQGHGREIRASSHTAEPITIQTPVGARGWDGEVGEKLVWMVGRQEQRAELVLNPPQLGRVEISLTVNGDQTSAAFVSANPAVREALEAALPRLREMFADAGISLGQAHVGADSGNNAANQSAGNRGNGENSSRYSHDNDAPLGGNILGQTETSQWLRQGRGMVDVFA